MKDTLEDLQSREIFAQRIIRLLRQRFPGRGNLEENGTLRDLCDAAYDIIQEDAPKDK